MPRRQDPRDLSSAAQEYLLALRVMAADGSKVTAAQVARHLGVTTQAASEMFRRLVADGLVAHADSRELHLTTAGRAAADTIFRRHALIEWLLTSVVGLGWAESDEEAMRLQGAISPRVEARLDEMLGHPETCPHGNPIDAAIAARRPKGIPLSEIEAGERATVYRITEEAEEDAGLLSYLEARALTAGCPHHGPRSLRLARFAHARGSAWARHAGTASRGARPRPPRGGRSDALPHGAAPDLRARDRGLARLRAWQTSACASHRARPARSTSGRRARRSTTTSMPATSAGRSSCASRTPTRHAPRSRTRRTSSTDCTGSA